MTQTRLLQELAALINSLQPDDVFLFDFPACRLRRARSLAEADETPSQDRFMIKVDEITGINMAEQY